MKHWKWMQIVGWLGVVVGLSGIIPGLFLLRGSMIELGLIILLLAVGVLWQAAVLEELRATRAALSRMALLVERMNVPGSYGRSPIGTDSVRTPDGRSPIGTDSVRTPDGMVPEEEKDVALR